MVDNQRTLKEVARLSGIGTFTGDEISVEIHPAPVDRGPSFELIRGNEVWPIPVGVTNVIEADNRTVLADPENEDRQVNIVEHVLGALYGLGIDNAIVKVTSTELPLIDGSALSYLQAIDKAGSVEQDAPRREIVIGKPIFIDDESVLLVLPFDGLRITYYLDHSNRDVVGKRVAQIDVTPENFRKRIGPARTFMRRDNAEKLAATGVIKHQDMNQVLLINENSTSRPLRYADEFVYHKMLDILGDFYLAGRRIRGHVVGIRSGHRQNRQMIRKIMEMYG